MNYGNTAGSTCPGKMSVDQVKERSVTELSNSVLIRAEDLAREIDLVLQLLDGAHSQACANEPTSEMPITVMLAKALENLNRAGAQISTLRQKLFN